MANLLIWTDGLDGTTPGGVVAATIGDSGPASLRAFFGYALERLGK